MFEHLCFKILKITKGERKHYGVEKNKENKFSSFYGKKSFYGDENRSRNLQYHRPDSGRSKAIVSIPIYAKVSVQNQMLSKQYEQKRGKVQKAKREILDIDERRYEVFRSKQMKHFEMFFF